MKLPEMEWGLLGVIASATFVKLITSRRQTAWANIVSSITAVFCGYIFTDPLAFYLGVEDNNLRYAICALLVLTGEGIVRFLVDVTSTSENAKTFLMDLIRAWRGK